MEININNNLSNQFKENLDSINSQFHSLLEDYKKNYILHKMTPTDNEYASIYLSNKNGLQQINNNLLTIKNNIQDNVINLNNDINQLNNKISIEKTDEIKLDKKNKIF